MKRFKKCPRPMKVQTVMLAKSVWYTPAAREWLKEHGFSHPRAAVGGNYLRYRQLEPTRCVRGSLRTVTLSIAKHIKAVVCCPKG